MDFIDPFCGSLAVSRALGGRGVISDAHPALMSMYAAIVKGWEPPAKLSKEDWLRAKALPDADPLKGFAGFACSFRGIYGGGYAGGYVGPVSNEGAIAAKTVLLRDVRELVARGCEFRCMDFFDIEPKRTLLYLDPPYVGTQQYAGLPPFDHKRFYKQILKWISVGAIVFVSEYEMPFGTVVWTKTRARKMGSWAVGSSRLQRATENLYLISPVEDLLWSK